MGQQIALTAIAAETKIKLSLLEELERDDVSLWPEGIYRRAHLRAYAQAIGLEPDVVVREFLELHPDSVQVLTADALVWPSSDSESVSAQSATLLRSAVTSAMRAIPSFLQRAHRNEPTIASVSAAGRDDTVKSERARQEPYLSARAGNDQPVAVEGKGDLSGHEPNLPASRRNCLAENEPIRLGTRVSADHNPPLESKVVRSKISLSAAAQLCTRLGQVLDMREVALVLEDVAKILDAVGLIVWSWDSRVTALTPWLAHGYSDAVLARFPTVHTDAENATAAAFRSGEASILNGGEGLTGAVVVPLMASSGCVGVLALEFQHGAEQHQSVRAFATIVAAQLVTLFGPVPLAEAVDAERHGTRDRVSADSACPARSCLGGYSRDRTGAIR